jgi:hypothetical protein
MIISNSLKLIIAGFMLSSVATRASAAEPPKDAPKVTYQDHVLPILRNSCLNCHNPDKKKGDLNLSSHQGAMAGSGGGKIIEPGDPDASKIIKVISWTEEPNMPPKGDKLPEKDIAIIKAWIAAGAPETSSSKVSAVKPKSNLAVVASIGKPEGPPPMPADAAKLSLEPIVTHNRNSAPASLASSPWAPLVAVGGQKQVLLYHADTLELIGILPFSEGLPRSLKFSRNGQLLIAGGGIGAKSGKVIAWNVLTGQRVAEVGEEFDEVLAADISPDQSHVALGTPLKILKIYTTSDGAQEHAVKKHTDWIQAVAYSPDGKFLASGDRAGGLWVWEADTARELYNCSGHKEGVTDAAFRGDSKILASASQDGTIKLWNMEDGKQSKSINAHPGGVLSIGFTHDGKIVSAGRDGNVKVWSPDGNALKTFEKFGDIALCATFNHDGSRVIAGDYTGAIHVWTLADAKRVGDLTANPPALAQRLAGMDQKIKELQAAAEKAASEAKAAQDAATQLAGEIKSASEARDAAQKALEAAQSQLAQKASGAVAPAAQVTTPEEVQAKREVRNRTRDAAVNAKAALEKSRKSSDSSDQEIKKLTEALAKADADAKSAADALVAAKHAATSANTAKGEDPAAKEAVAKAKSDLEAAQKSLEARTNAQKEAADRVTKSQAAAKSAVDALGAAQTQRAKLQQTAPRPAQASK